MIYLHYAWLALYETFFHPFQTSVIHKEDNRLVVERYPR
jgi:hypothetical protein